MQRGTCFHPVDDDSWSPSRIAWRAVMAVALLLAVPAWAQGPARLHGFGPDSAWTAAYAASSQQVCLCGDVNGDHLDDLIIFHRGTPGKEGKVDVCLNVGGRFAEPVRWHEWFCIGEEIPKVGDFDGDGRCDIATFVRSTQTGDAAGDVYVGLSNGTTFVSSRWHAYFCLGEEVPVVGDFNGDGCDDIATCTRGTTADVFVALSNGSGEFVGTGVLWHANFCPGTAIPIAGDFNGDGTDDLAAFMRSSVPGQEGQVHVTLALRDTPLAFSGDEIWHNYFCVNDEIPAVADVNADGLADILTLAPNGADSDLYVALASTFHAFVGSDKWHDSLLTLPSQPSLLTGHFNGDANADVMTTGHWLLPLDLGDMGVATVALCGAHAAPLPAATAGDRTTLAADFGYGTLGLPTKNFPDATRTVPEERYLLCVLVGAPAAPPPDAREAFALTAAQAATLCFGPAHPNMRSYFSEMSGGKFTFKAANKGGGTGVIGPLTVATPPADTWSYALSAIDPTFDFSQYDLDNDGDVETNELTILVIDNFTRDGGANRFRTLSADGKSVRLDMAAAGHLSAFQNPAHEISHSLGTIDLYNQGCYSAGATLMSCTAGNVANEYWHLDAWHKMRLGWFIPRVYDVGEYPAGAWISAAQANGTAAFEAPVMLYDAKRGTREHYTLEYRNPQFNDGASGWAGYDQHVAGRGLATWYVRATPTNDTDYDAYAIAAGGNGVLDTTPAGDDLVSGTTLVTGTNGILESTPAGDDGYIADNLCFLTLTPTNRTSRQNVEFYNDPAQVLAPNWWTKPAPGVSPADVPSGISLRTTAFKDGCYVEWGNDFSPWLDEPLVRNLTAGRTYFFSGNLGIRERLFDGVAYAVLRKPNGDEYALNTVLGAGDTQWDGRHAYWQVPLSVPPGTDYTVRLYRSAGRSVVSNAWPVEVTNRYYGFVLAHFTPAELNSPLWVSPLADVDGDALPNAIEFVIGSDPRNGADGTQYLTTSLDANEFQLHWSGPLAAEDFFNVTVETSTDLKSWTTLPPPTRVAGQQFVSYTASISRANNPRGFVRLHVTCPPY